MFRLIFGTVRYSAVHKVVPRQVCGFKLVSMRLHVGEFNMYPKWPLFHFACH